MKQPEHTTFGRGARCVSLCCAAALVAPFALSASRATKLVDGSPAPAVPTVLRPLGPTLVMTKVRVGTVGSLRAAMPGCPEARTSPRREPAVERIGVAGRSVTFLPSRTQVAGCDRNPQARRFSGPWCGSAGWFYGGGRVADPRLTICYRPSGAPLIAFGWINPLPHARWIVVDQPGYREVYPVAAGLPVRVSTVSGLGRLGGAIFHTSQYDRNGVLLAGRKVVASIAG